MKTCRAVVLATILFAPGLACGQSKGSNERSAIRMLKSIATAQSLFREGDKDRNKAYDYANSVDALSKTGLIPKLPKGVWKGYRFKVTRSQKTPEFLWMATASPVKPGVTGDRHFAIDYTGLTYHALQAFAHTDDCKLKGVLVLRPLPGWKPVVLRKGLAKLLSTLRAKRWRRFRRYARERPYRQQGGENLVVVVEARVRHNYTKLELFRMVRGGWLEGGQIRMDEEGSLTSLRLITGHISSRPVELRGKLEGKTLVIEGKQRKPLRAPFDEDAIPLTAALFVLPVAYDVWPTAELRFPVYGVPGMALGGRSTEPPRRLKGALVMRRQRGTRPDATIIRLKHPELGTAQVCVSTLGLDRGQIRYVKGFGGELLLPTDREEMDRIFKAEKKKAAAKDWVVSNEAYAIGALRTIGTSQSLFREGDKDGNGQFDYAGDLAALGKTRLITKELASGTFRGYRFKVTRAKKTPQYHWMATASPLKPGKSGIRHFATTHEGITYHSLKPFTHTDDCKLRGIPVGKTLPGYAPPPPPQRPTRKLLAGAKLAQAKAELSALKAALANYKSDMGRYPRMAPRPTGLKDAEAAMADDCPILYAALANKPTLATGGGQNSPYITWKPDRVAILDRLYLGANQMAETGGFGLAYLRGDQQKQLDSLSFQKKHLPKGANPLVFLDPWGYPYHYREWASVRSSVKALLLENKTPRTVSVRGKKRQVLDHPHVAHGFDIWSNGPNGVNEYGAPGSDDVVSWR